ncbi:MAG: polyprenol monophosphomannose synthase [Gammaproteobacteria bacterium]|nr:polyprenol monophosphomannose synthase [Gammaproteobacteria bacterium]
MRFSISIIVPTYNERPNIELFVSELFETLKPHQDIDAELIVVDDNSPDGTAAAVRALASDYPVKAICRPGKQGLGTAVMEGFAASNRPLVAVMDGDLSHDPAVLPQMIRATADNDLAVGSRFGEQSRVEQWTFGRKWLSLAGVAVARQLTGLQDPLSGYFCLRRSVLDSMRYPLVSPGYKILLEIMMSKGVHTHRSFDYTFRKRQFSTSKLNHREYILFINQLVVFGFRKLVSRPSEQPGGKTADHRSVTRSGKN